MVRSIIATLDATNRDEVAVGMTRPERRCVDQVVRDLPEPGRTIFRYRENGMTPDEISREIRVALSDYETSADT